MEMINAIGRRKTAVARVYLMKAEGIEPSTYGLRVHCSAN